MGLNRDIRNQIKKMPKYKINDEAFQTQNIARAEAFGKDRDIQLAQEDIDADVAAATGDAKDITNSTSALLAALTDINQGGFNAKRDLAKFESGDLRRQKIGNLYQANDMMIDEKDKAWNQNVMAPWDAKLRALNQKKANRSAFWNNVVGGLLSAGGSFLGGGGGGASNSGTNIDASLNTGVVS